MKKTMFALTAISTAVAISLIACKDEPKKAGTTVVISADSLVKRGSYLVNAIGCDDCHSPKTFGAQGPAVDMEHRFAGHLANSPLGKIDPAVLKNGWLLFSPDLTVAVGPWGISYAANISSDATGIGNWTEDQFLKAMRHGKLKGLDESRPLLPPMPWQNFSKLTDIDLKAMFAYLKSTKPVENRVPEPKPASEL